MAPKISVIVATFNRSDVLRWAVQCVLAQTFQDWELIVVGDACTDDTPELMAGFHDPRIRFVNLTVNIGEQSGPNNHGFALSRSELIAYLNHDDLWFPDHLATLAARLEQDGADLAYALPVSIDANGLVFCGIVDADLRYKPPQFVPASLWLARRELIAKLGGWRKSREVFARNPSQEFLFRAWKEKCKMVCSPRTTALILPSGSSPMAYVKRDDSQHKSIFESMADPAFRERLMTRAAIRSAQANRFGPAWFQRVIDRAIVAFRHNPEAVRNRLAGRRPGFWIDYLREFRGLPPKPRSEKNE